MIKHYLMLVVLSVVLTGCQLTRVEGKVHDVDVKVSTNDEHSHGKFCPPGQAKKGNC